MTTGLPALFDTLLSEAIRERQLAQDKREAELSERANALLKRETDIDTLVENAVKARKRELDQIEENLRRQEMSINATVADKVATKIQELNELEELLNSQQNDIAKTKRELNEQQEAIARERAQLAKSRAQFQKEGGEKFFAYISSVENAPEDVTNVEPFKGTPIPKNLVEVLGRSFTSSQYSNPLQLISKFLVSTMTAALTGQFVVLSGPTGVGKTSMVSTFSAALGAGCGVVPVRPAWIDPTDLLGF